MPGATSGEVSEAVWLEQEGYRYGRGQCRHPGSSIVSPGFKGQQRGKRADSMALPFTAVQVHHCGNRKEAVDPSTAPTLCFGPPMCTVVKRFPRSYAFLSSLCACNFATDPVPCPCQWLMLNPSLTSCMVWVREKPCWYRRFFTKWFHSWGTYNRTQECQYSQSYVSITIIQLTGWVRNYTISIQSLFLHLFF